MSSLVATMLVVTVVGAGCSGSIGEEADSTPGTTEANNGGPGGNGFGEVEGECASFDAVASYTEVVRPALDTCEGCHLPDLSGPAWMDPSSDAVTVDNLISGGYINLAQPDQSWLLLYPLAVSAGGLVHGGGDQFVDTSDPAYKAALSWVGKQAECVPTGGECNESASLALYQRRVEPLVSGSRPDSCSQCHFAGVGLDAYVQDTACQTMACLVEVGEVTLDEPEESPILGRILLAEPDSELITEAVIRAEYDGFLEWIKHSAECHEGVCGDIDDPCNAGTGTRPPPEVLDPLGICDQNDLVRVFDEYVYQWRGRCASCHAVGGQAAGYDPFADENPNNDPTCTPAPVGAAPLIFPAAEAADAPLLTFFNAVGLGSIDVANPEASTWLTKPLDVAEGGVCHGGGSKIQTKDEKTYRDFLYFTQYYSACMKGEDPGLIEPPAAEVQVSIEFPPNNRRFHQGVIEFKGNGLAADGTPLRGEALTWRSSLLDGPFAYGSEWIVLDAFPLGEHLITLTATDAEGNAAEVSRTITIVP